MFCDSFQSYVGFQVNNDILDGDEPLTDIEKDMLMIDNVMKSVNYYVQGFYHNRRILNEFLNHFNTAVHHRQTASVLVEKINQLEKYLLNEELFNEVLRVKKVRESINNLITK